MIMFRPCSNNKKKATGLQVPVALINLGVALTANRHNPTRNQRRSTDGNESADIQVMIQNEHKVPVSFQC